MEKRRRFRIKHLRHVDFGARDEICGGDFPAELRYSSGLLN